MALYKIMEYPDGTPIQVERAKRDTKGYIIAETYAKIVDTLIKVEVPASASAEGSVGQYALDTNYLYLCVDTNTWKRIALSSW